MSTYTMKFYFNKLKSGLKRKKKRFILIFIACILMHSYKKEKRGGGLERSYVSLWAIYKSNKVALMVSFNFKSKWLMYATI